MKVLFNLEEFIGNHVTGRSVSLVGSDLDRYQEDLRQEIEGKSVLVIGAAGTIGSSFVRSILPYKPGKLLVVDFNENGLTELVRDCRSRSDLSLPQDFKSYPINYGDPVFGKILRKEGRFHIVANFAAHKHVRSEKDIFSIEAMIDNNVIKAKRLLDMLATQQPDHFFCVSTDKAANPVNIMGASKKLMEEIILAYSGRMSVTTARFANVAFSNGSLLAGFMERLLKGQPLSCPSDVKRFFVSPVESGHICMVACVLGRSGEVFFPKLADDSMVNFADIVPSFLHEFGYKMEVCSTEEEARDKVNLIREGRYPVYFFSSSTSGEKLYEEFYTDGEVLDLDRFNALGVISNAYRRSEPELAALVTKLEDVFRNSNEKSAIINLLNTLLPSFQHVETGQNLDQKM